MNNCEIKEFSAWVAKQDIAVLVAAGIDADKGVLEMHSLDNVVDVAEHDQLSVAKSTFLFYLDDIENTKSVFGVVA